MKITREKPKLTPHREAVFQVIQERDDHPTASDIFEAARLRLPSISYATVYNSLRYLKEAGLVLEINLGDSASRTIARPNVTITPSVTTVESWSTLICPMPQSSCRPRQENPVSNLSRFT